MHLRVHKKILFCNPSNVISGFTLYIPIGACLYDSVFCFQILFMLILSEMISLYSYGCISCCIVCNYINKHSLFFYPPKQGKLVSTFSFYRVEMYIFVCVSENQIFNS